MEGLQQIRIGVDKTAAEMALVAYPKRLRSWKRKPNLAQTPPIQAIPVSSIEGIAAFVAFYSISMMILVMMAGQVWWPLLLVIAVDLRDSLAGSKNKRQNTSKALLQSSEALLQSELGKVHTQLRKKQAQLADNHQLLQS